ncbi:transposase domain-containing protein, partial [Escherichia coli]|uniref:transposase domain-containing protein n=1 Tax=Escherichia coli TaxID=562 RepID=UPI00201CFF5D
SLQGKISSDGCLKKEQMVVSAIASTPHNVEPEKWLRYVIEHIQDWPANRVRDLLPWKVDLSSQ